LLLKLSPSDAMARPLRLGLTLFAALVIIIQVYFQRHEPSTTTTTNQTTQTIETQHRNIMGTTSSTTTTKTKDYITKQDDDTIYALIKKRPGCTGMFWRPDPAGKINLQNNNDWPKDGAMLKGEVVRTIQGQQWLAATHVKNTSDGEWKETPYGAYMPFEYDNHYYLEVTK
jgi:hypothetical protein